MNRCRMTDANGLTLEDNFERFEQPKSMYDFRISKVMTVCIDTCMSICDSQSNSKIDLSRTDLIISTAYLLRN